MDERTNPLDVALNEAALGLGAGRYEPETMGTTLSATFQRIARSTG